MAFDRLDVEALLGIARGDDGTKRRAERALREELDERRRRVLLQDPDSGCDVARLQRIAHRRELRERGKKLAGVVFARPLSHDGNLVAAGGEADPERLLDGPQVLIGDPEKGGEPRVG